MSSDTSIIASLGCEKVALCKLGAEEENKNRYCRREFGTISALLSVRKSDDSRQDYRTFVLQESSTEIDKKIALASGHPRREVP